MIRIVVVALAFSFATSSAFAQAWDLVPTVGFGMGSAGDRDEVGDAEDEALVCPSSLGAAQCLYAARVLAMQRRVAPTASVGLRVDRTFSSRFALTFGISARLGPADRFVEDERRIAPEARFRFVALLQATGRIRLGPARRGFVGAGPAFGWLAEPNGRSAEGVNPDEPTAQRSVLSGVVLEALLEAGLRLGARRRIELSVVGGAGRPLWHAEARLALPIAIGE